MDQQVKQWLDYAAQDLGVARHLFENYHPKPLEIVCYHCQQSAEKAIKAVIVSLHWPTGIIYQYHYIRLPCHDILLAAFHVGKNCAQMQ